jgi:hypothetical protein
MTTEAPAAINDTCSISNSCAVADASVNSIGSGTEGISGDAVESPTSVDNFLLEAPESAEKFAVVDLCPGGTLRSSSRVRCWPTVCQLFPLSYFHHLHVQLYMFCLLSLSHRASACSPNSHPSFSTHHLCSYTLARQTHTRHHVPEFSPASVPSSPSCHACAHIHCVCVLLVLPLLAACPRLCNSL